MLTSDVISILRWEIDSAKKKGLSEVSLESLSNLVGMIETESHQTPEGVDREQARIEQFKSSLVDWQNDNQRNHESQMEMLRATIATSHLAIKSALIINGGAAVAFLAFLGTAWSRFSGAAVKGLLASSLEHFVMGVMFTGVGAGVAYICQAAFGDEFGKHSEKIGGVLRWLAVFLVLGSFWKFYEGCQVALKAFIIGG
ncbi:hypothetical protein [Pseudomonas sp. GL-RE-29]|uniref:hypothetical protein n=1 Tax=Pseudomonas sp. GL-RE-29 TaxID=2832375 RepID=UPI001CBC2214|nr:hypothetical protein [Pseudomonas sp. GL-RE-29]